MSTMSDRTKAIIFLVVFVLFIPALYLAPTILNALTDLVMKFTG